VPIPKVSRSLRPKAPPPRPATPAERLLGVVGVLALVAFLGIVARTFELLRHAARPSAELSVYMALALEWEEKDPLELHKRTFELARTELTPEAFRELTTKATAASLQDPEVFRERLPSHRGEVLYSILLRWLQQMGQPLSAVASWIPLAAYAMLALLALAWAIGHAPLGAAAMIALGIALTPALVHQASEVGPGGLAALFVCMGAFFMIERRLFAFGAAILTLAIAVHGDALLFVPALALALFLCMPRLERPPLFGILAWIALSVAGYVALQRFAGDPGWWARFQEEFVDATSRPAEAVRAFDWEVYRQVLTRQLEALPGEGSGIAPAPGLGGALLLFYAVLALLGLAIGLRMRARHGREAGLLLALLLAGAVRFLLFPSLSGGAWVPFYVLVPLALLTIVVRELRREPIPAAPSAVGLRRRR
jgi:hypothetical protein